MGIPPGVPVKAAKSIGPCPYCRADCPGRQRPAHPPGASPGVPAAWLPAAALRPTRKVLFIKIERFQPEGINVRMSGGKPSYSHIVTVRRRLNKPSRTSTVPEGGRRHLGRRCQDQPSFATIVGSRTTEHSSADLLSLEGLHAHEPEPPLNARDHRAGARQRQANAT